MLVGELGPFGMAEVALRLLHSLVALQPAEGEGGRTLYPLPLVQRQIAGPTCLPHIAQATLIIYRCLILSRLVSSRLISSRLTFSYCLLTHHNQQ